MERTVILPGSCKLYFKAHPAHEYREHWWSIFKTYCPGKPFIEQDPWESANPSIGVSVNPNALRAMQGLEPHKHRLHLSGWSWNTGWGIPREHPDAELSFSCREPYCNYEVSMYRWQYQNLVWHQRNVDQIWPT